MHTHVCICKYGWYIYYCVLIQIYYTDADDYTVTDGMTITIPACTSCTTEDLSFNYTGITIDTDRILEDDETIVVEFDQSTLNPNVTINSFEGANITIERKCNVKLHIYSITCMHIIMYSYIYSYLS